MPLQVSTRTVGNIALVQCNGRIVSGESAVLEAEVRKCFSELLSVVVDLKDVTHIDSSGLGMLVRLTSCTRTTDVQMNLCAAAPSVQKLFTLTNLSSVLQNHPSPDEAMRALQSHSSVPQPETSSPLIVCVHESIDLLAWLRESLGRNGFQVQTASAVPDATILIKARRPKLVITSQTLSLRIATVASDRNIRVLELDPGFAQRESADALDSLLADIRSLQHS